MTAAFLRLLFIAAVTAYLLGLILLARTFGWPAGLGCALGGLVLAVLLAEDWTPRSSSPAGATVDGAPVARRRGLGRSFSTSTLDEQP